MPKPLPALLAAAVLLMGLAGPAHAWSFKEHILVTRLAVQRLLADPQTPEEMKAWLRQAAPTAGDHESARRFLLEEQVRGSAQGLEMLDYWSVFPDVARNTERDKPVKPFGVPESPMHFFDLELLMPGEGVREYRHDLSSKPDLADIPRDWRDPRLVQAGYLPWRIEQVYDELVRAIAEGRLMPQDEEDRDNALVLAGYLSHYLADNTQPHHATIDYRSASYFAQPRKAPNVHGMMEYGLVDWEDRGFPELRAQLWEKLCAYLASADLAREQVGKIDGIVAVTRIDPWTTSVEIARSAYDALPLIGIAAQAAAGQEVEEGDPTRPIGPARPMEEFDIETFFTHSGRVNGRETTLLDIKARQLALATLRVESLLRQAWLESQEPPATRPAGEPDGAAPSPAE